MRRREFMIAGGAATGALMAPAILPAAEQPGVPAGEAIIDPERPIIDAHHHLWDNPGSRYLFPDFLADVNDGHRIVKTVFVQSGSMYRADGPEERRSLGETEFANGVAAMSASGIYGASRVDAGIVCSVDLRPGARVRELLEAHIAVGGGRVRGVRASFPWDDVIKMPSALHHTHLLSEPGFRRGFAQLARLGLAFETWCFFRQLPEVADLARAFPGTTIIINHLGTPVLVREYAARQEEVRRIWLEGVKACAAVPNLYMKLGGLGMKPFGEFLFNDHPPTGSEALADLWRPYIESCIEHFGPQRCMFESNFPADRTTCSYRVLWNAFKRIASPYSESEKTALFSGAASKAYKL